jgi:hypothetical protein
MSYLKKGNYLSGAVEDNNYFESQWIAFFNIASKGNYMHKWNEAAWKL